MEHVKRTLANLSEEVAALQACLLSAGLLCDTQLQVHLHQQRFRAACLSSKWIPDAATDLHRVVQVSGIADSTIGFLGHHSARNLVVASRQLCTHMHEQTSHVYVFGGGHAPGHAAHTVERWTPGTGKWEVQPLRMPVGAWDLVTAIFGGRVYLCGVGLDDRGGQVMCFDPHVQSRYPWRLLPQNIPTPRIRTAAAALSGKLYVCGGIMPGSFEALSCVECFDPQHGGTWETLAPMKKHRVNGACAPLAGQLLVCGGSQGGHNWMHTIHRSTELYKPEIGEWAEAPDMNSNRMWHCAASVASGVYVCGGIGPTTFPYGLRSAEVKWAESKSWCKISETISPRIRASSVVLGGRVYIFGGVQVHTDSTVKPLPCLSSVERYSPDFHKWEQVSRMPDVRSGHATAVAAMTTTIL